MVHCSIGLGLVLLTSSIGSFASLSLRVLVIEAGVRVLEWHSLIRLQGLTALVSY